MPIIETENLTKAFGRGDKRKLAVNDVNLSIERGQVYGFLGPNGAGKTTTIRMLLGLMHPTQGRVLVLGRDPHKEPDTLRQVGALVEGATFYPYLTAWDNLRVIGNSQGGFDPKRGEYLLESMELKEATYQRVKGYSTGMKQRLGIAAALLHDPELVILDEPTNGMDPSGIKEMRTFIRDLVYQHGKTVFLTSHLLSEVQQTCDRLAIIHQGRIIQEGAIDDLLNRHAAVEVEVGQVERAFDVLQERWPVQQNNNCLRVEASREVIPTMVRLLVEHEVDLYGITPYQQSLEEYFLMLVEGTPQ